MGAYAARGGALNEIFAFLDGMEITMTVINWDPPPATDAQIEQHLGSHAGLARVDRARMSRLLCDQLVHGIVTRTLDFFAVADVLQALEDASSTRHHVETLPFKHPPLKGLMHAHFTQASFIPRNLINEIRSKRGQPFDAAWVTAAGANSHADAINIIAHKATIGMYESRAGRNALTGEWIVYAEHNEQRFYLSLASHDEGDNQIYERMQKRCGQTFQQIMLAIGGNTAR